MYPQTTCLAYIWSSEVPAGRAPSISGSSPPLQRQPHQATADEEGGGRLGDHCDSKTGAVAPVLRVGGSAARGRRCEDGRGVIVKTAPPATFRADRKRPTQASVSDHFDCLCSQTAFIAQLTSAHVRRRVGPKPHEVSSCDQP